MNIRNISICLAVFALVGTSVNGENDQQSIVNGKKIYAKKCQNCHGANGRGGTPISKAMNVGNLSRSRSETELFRIISSGPGKMPGFSRSLSDGEIRDVANYVQTFAN